MPNVSGGLLLLSMATNDIKWMSEKTREGLCICTYMIWTANQVTDDELWVIELKLFKSFLMFGLLLIKICLVKTSQLKLHFWLLKLSKDWIKIDSMIFLLLVLFSLWTISALLILTEWFAFKICCTIALFVSPFLN